MAENNASGGCRMEELDMHEILSDIRIEPSEMYR